jgi:hypothetical protein
LHFEALPFSLLRPLLLLFAAADAAADGAERKATLKAGSVSEQQHKNTKSTLNTCDQANNAPYTSWV